VRRGAFRRILRRRRFAAGISKRSRRVEFRLSRANERRRVSREVVRRGDFRRILRSGDSRSRV
jgi:hypothetical protein